MDSKYGSIAVLDGDAIEAMADQQNDVSVASKTNRCSKTLGFGLILGSLLLAGAHKNSGSSFGSFLSLSKPHVLDMNEALFYKKQPVDHFDDEDQRTWSNRYYKSTKYFNGPGSPIFVIVGGEGALDHGMLYPFVTEVLAKRFGAAVLQIEHRFYGPYHPILDATPHELLKLLTPHQAMTDMVQLTRHVRDREFGCSPHRSSKNYCPVITVGGSYPGFLSAMFRFVYPDFVDISYASAAPLLMYGQAIPNNVYYDIVTAAAERSDPGCPNAVRRTLEEMQATVKAAPTLKEAASRVGVCPDSLPTEYVQTKEDLSNAVIMTVAYAFANYNSENYPPGPDTQQSKACQLFLDTSISNLKTLENFFQYKVEDKQAESAGCDLAWVNCDATPELKSPKCFNMGNLDDDSIDDDTPSEDANDGFMWNFQTCTDVIFLAGFSNTSMFPPRNATYKDLADECHNEFGPDITPSPWELVHKWNYVDGLKDVSYIIFTNGMQDMWAGGSVLEDISDTVIAINFENGAHHSDLSHQGPTDQDTPDIKAGFIEISDALAEWLHDLEMEWKSNK